MRSNWSGTVDFANPLALPTSTEAVGDLVRDHQQVLAVGSAHSFSDAAVTPGLHVCVSELPVAITIADGTAADGTATVSAGMRYAALGPALHDRGLALAAMASLPHISVAGAIATGTHGSGDGIGTLSTAVSALDVVIGDGTSVHVTRADTDFPGWVVALGALGIVTGVTLDVEPTYDVAQTVLTGLDLDTLESHFDEIFTSATSVSVFTRWRPGADGQIWLKRRADREGPWRGGDAFGARVSSRAMHPLETLDPVNCNEQGGVPGPWFERLPHFRANFTPSSGDEIQSEYLLPRETAVEGIRHVRMLSERITPLLHVTEIRTMRADDLWLSPAYGRDTVGIHFTWMKDPRILDVLPDIEAGLLPLGARPHWGKVSTASPRQIVSAYPRFADFRDLAVRIDPAGKFCSPLVSRLFAEID